jgi:L-fucose isomerase-like protein
MIAEARHALVEAGFQLLEPAGVIQELSHAREAAAKLAESPPDLVIVFQATFADSTMVTEIAQSSEAPLFLWGVPEAWRGERLRLNSLCGINLAGHALTLRKHPYAYAYAMPGEADVLVKVRELAQGGYLRRRLKDVRLGVVGEHPAGMDTCHLDEPRLKEAFGIQIKHIALEQVFTRARAIPETTIRETRATLETQLEDLDTLEAQPLKGTLSVYHALKEIAIEQDLDGLAVRCWPEFFTKMGCAACGAMSMLSDGLGMKTPLPCSCEADVNGTLTQMMLAILADAPSFGTDIVGANDEYNRIALWHCGLAPLSMADPAVPVRGGIHSNRQVPLVMDFRLKPGVVTVARLSQATGELRLVLGKGEIQATPKPFSGTSGTLKLDIPTKDFLDLLLYEGLEHHVSIVYGDYLNALENFARQINLPVMNMLKEVRH